MIFESQQECRIGRELRGNLSEIHPESMQNSSTRDTKMVGRESGLNV